jgi:hypothetical protein
MWEVAAAGAALGALGGSQGNTATSSTALGGSSKLGKETNKSLRELLEELQGMNKAGAGTKDVSNAVSAQRDFASMLKKFSEGGFQPSSSDYNMANNQAANLFGGQRAAMQNSFLGQTQASNAQASRLGRSINDPILQAQLRTSLFQQENELSGQQNALAQQLAMNAPMQRLQFAGQRSDVLNQLSSQAYNNRMTLAGFGQGVMGLENQLRIGGATTTQNSGGGFGGAVTGALAGAGIGAKTGSMFMGQDKSTTPYDSFYMNKVK